MPDTKFIFFHVLALVIWLRTEAIVEYGRLFRLSKLLRIDDYDKKKLEDFELDYILYLRRYHNSFIIRMITCPICLMCWAALPFMFVFGIETYSTNVLVTLFLYYLFVKAMK